MYGGRTLSDGSLLACWMKLPSGFSPRLAFLIRFQLCMCTHTKAGIITKSFHEDSPNIKEIPMERKESFLSSAPTRRCRGLGFSIHKA
ncbi:uncharacterized protein L203_106216 [Cryptococcus depauperatus CBS 7841]|uniref:Uncharacterized protein n=1 Tax=Cryptococcus depauperatus CBS 7841 TaxID=1295531 RepID=A0AAJ8JYW6_9TREE